MRAIPIVPADMVMILLALDQAVPRLDKSWAEYLVGAVREFVVWRLPPAGFVDEETTAWLTSLTAERPTPDRARHRSGDRARDDTAGAGRGSVGTVMSRSRLCEGARGRGGLSRRDDLLTVAVQFCGEPS